MNNKDILFVLSDTRNCRSNNMQKYFRTRDAMKESDRTRVIRFDGDLWFATLGWLARGKENGFAGVKVREVACYGNKAKTGYPNWQKGGDWEDVTDWFWEKYRERGMVSIPEIWHIEIPRQQTHRELHTM